MEKRLYKILVYFLKVAPYILGLVYFINSILLIFQIELAILSVFGYVSIVTLLFLLAASFTFKFCTYHRMPLYYIVANSTLNWLDYLIEFNITDYNFLVIHLIIAGICMFLTIYFKKIRKNV